MTWRIYEDDRLWRFHYEAPAPQAQITLTFGTGGYRGSNGALFSFDHPDVLLYLIGTTLHVESTPAVSASVELSPADADSLRAYIDRLPRRAQEPMDNELTPSSAIPVPAAAAAAGGRRLLRRRKSVRRIKRRQRL